MTDTPKPKRTLEECRAILVSPGMPHETELALINNRILPAYKTIDPNLRTFWLRCSVAHPEWDYLIFEQERYTFKQVLDASKDVANVLREFYGVRKGDRVAVSMRNLPEYVILFWACGLLGAVPTLINPWLTDEQLLSCMNKTRCKIHIVDPERADRFESLASGDSDIKLIVARSHEGKGYWKGMENWNTIFKGSRAICQDWELEPACNLEDDCVILFTSGTTSMPKAVLSTQRSFISNHISASYCVLFDMLRRGQDLSIPDSNAPQTTNLLAAPLFHASGITSSMMGSTAASSKNVLVRKWDPETVVQLIRTQEINTISAVPSMTVDLLQRSSDLAQTLRIVMTGGGPLPITVPRAMAEKISQAVFVQAYGLTETNAIASLMGGIDQLAKPESCGFPVPICEFLIVDPDNGKIMPSGQVGEIWIRGSNIFKCYFNDPAATRKALTDDGWFRSGDAGYLDDDGCLFVKDRFKDIIIRGGENIHSTTVENVLHEHPEILDAAVVGIPDYRLGELVAAVVTIMLGSKLNEQEVINFAKKKLPRMAVPVLISVRNEFLERNATGKILKKILKSAVCAEWERRKAQSNIHSKL